MVTVVAVYCYYLLTAIGLSPGGSGTDKTIKITKQQNSYKTRKVSTQTEHRKYKYNTFYKTRVLKTTTAQDTH